MDPPESSPAPTISTSTPSIAAPKDPGQAPQAPRPAVPTSTSSAPSLSAAEKALKESLEPGEFRDVHFYAFTRRIIFSDGSIQIDHPLPIVAIGSILKETEHFSALLTSGFAETSPSSPEAIRQYAHESEYDYDSDSDLDEFEDALETISTPAVSRVVGKGKSKVGAGPDDNDVCNSPSSDANLDVAKHHSILIPNIAHRTLKACIFYLYTGKINFLPLTSRGRAQRSFAMLTTSKSAPACSPKSMYWLAESYGIPKLQDLAYREITSQLTPMNIVQETFSSFFARYDRLREDGVSYLSQHYSNLAIQDVLPQKIEDIASGYLPHAGGALRSLLGLRVSLSPRPPPPLFSQSFLVGTTLHGKKRHKKK